MRHRKHLYDVAKQSGKLEDWAAYRSMRNLVNYELECAHNAYCSKLFDDSFSGNRRQFWKYIRTRRKDLLVSQHYLSITNLYQIPKGKLPPLATNFSQFSLEKI